jgi:sulfite dehydrogenase (cytochrome) subunit B
MKRAFLVPLLLVASMARADEQAIALKPGPGQEVTTAACAACHSLDYIQMNSVFLTGDGWKAEVAKMRQAYGAPIADDAAEQIAKYLASNYAVPPPS